MGADPIVASGAVGRPEPARNVGPLDSWTAGEPGSSMPKRTMRSLLAAAALTGALAACGGGDGDADDAAESESGDSDTAATGGGCPPGAPSVRLGWFAMMPPDDVAGVQAVEVDLSVFNGTDAGVVVDTVEVQFGSTWHDIAPAGDAPAVAASQTHVVEGDLELPTDATPVAAPGADGIRLGWSWESDEHRDCATPQPDVDVSAFEGVPQATPQAPPDALALGETATFSYNGQEVRVTVTGVAPFETCPDDRAPPAEQGYMAVTVRLEVGPGPEPWLVSAWMLDTLPGGDVTRGDTAFLCTGADTSYNNVQAGPGQTAEGTFVFDGLGPAISYTFEPYDQEGQTVSWAL